MWLRGSNDTAAVELRIGLSLTLAADRGAPLWVYPLRLQQVLIKPRRTKSVHWWQRGGGLLSLVNIKSAHPPYPFDTHPPLCTAVFFLGLINTCCNRNLAKSLHLKQIERGISTIVHLDNDVSASRLLAWQINNKSLL